MRKGNRFELLDEHILLPTSVQAAHLEKSFRDVTLPRSRVDPAGEAPHAEERAPSTARTMLRQEGLRCGLVAMAAATLRKKEQCLSQH